MKNERSRSSISREEGESWLVCCWMGAVRASSIELVEIDEDEGEEEEEGWGWWW